MLSTYKYLHCELLDKVLLVTIKRDEKLNAMNSVMMDELRDCFRNVKELNEVFAVVLTGKGRAFMAGADIEGYDNFDMEQFFSFQERGREMYRAIEGCSKPVIAAVNGYALGGGFELVLSCDIVIAAQHAKFGLPEVKLALVPGGGGVQKLSRIAGPYLAKELLMTGRFLSAEEGRELRFINQVVDSEKLLEVALTLAENLGDLAPLAIKGLKKLVNEGLEASLETAQALDRAVLTNLFYTMDAKEGIAAFLEKRTPVFKGK
jgi:enoyl-CoA hydratase